MSQLNFFLTDKELRDKLIFAHSTGVYKIFAGRFYKTDNPNPIQDINNLIDFDCLTIWVNNEFTEPVCSLKGQGDYADYSMFDYYYDPIIELDKCKFSSRLISPGRIFYKSGWIKNKELNLVHKKNANRFIRIINKDLLKLSSPFRISDGIKSLMHDGYEIELGEGGMRLNNENYSL